MLPLPVKHLKSAGPNGPWGFESPSRHSRKSGSYVRIDRPALRLGRVRLSPNCPRTEFGEDLVRVVYSSTIGPRSAARNRPRGLLTATPLPRGIDCGTRRSDGRRLDAAARARRLGRADEVTCRQRRRRRARDAVAREAPAAVPASSCATVTLVGQLQSPLRDLGVERRVKPVADVAADPRDADGLPRDADQKRGH